MIKSFSILCNGKICSTLSCLTSLSVQYPNATTYLMIHKDNIPIVKDFVIKIRLNIIYVEKDISLNMYLNELKEQKLLVKYLQEYFRLLKYAVEHSGNTVVLVNDILVINTFTISDELFEKDICGIINPNTNKFQYYMLLINSLESINEWKNNLFKTSKEQYMKIQNRKNENVIISTTSDVSNNEISTESSDNESSLEISDNDIVKDDTFQNIYFENYKNKTSLFDTDNSNNFGILSKANIVTTIDFISLKGKLEGDEIKLNDEKVFVLNDVKVGGLIFYKDLYHNDCHIVNVKLGNKISRKAFSLLKLKDRNKLAISLPKKESFNKWNTNHCDGIYELIDLWKTKYSHVLKTYETFNNYIQVDDNFILYDRPTNEWFSNELFNKTIYCGSLNVATDCDELKQYDITHYPWIYWPKHPKQVEQFLLDNSYNTIETRASNTVFIGNAITAKQWQHRLEESLNDIIEVCMIHTNEEDQIPYEEYLAHIAKSKFGICLSGNNIKSTRLMEYLAFGTVPIIVGDDINTSSFEDILQINTHFLRINNIDELQDIIDKITEQQWSVMSSAGKEWYYKNIHSNNSFRNLFTNIIYS